jgi:hypothetical protein
MHPRAACGQNDAEEPMEANRKTELALEGSASFGERA